ncbi:MAG: GNAT family N-acetyltransferase, partial [Desulfomonilaceae bacterium]
YIDLNVDLSLIRRNLDGKWRNMLTVAEKNGLLLERGNNDHLFEWMLARYAELTIEKDFTGIPFQTLRALRNASDKHTRLIIMRAVDKGQPVACVCIFTHGATATYLIGWNGKRGRQLKAHQFLLWNAIVELKQCGCHWFDLGGIDVDNTPGISEFKLGLNGIRYELIGEYLKY